MRFSGTQLYTDAPSKRSMKAAAAQLQPGVHSIRRQSRATATLRAIA
jgi:hypothetical protein